MALNPGIKDHKLDEAKFFLDRMNEAEQDPRVHGFYLSAFISAARSVLQIAREEVWGKGGQSWYEKQESDPLTNFMRLQRNINIHEDVVQTIGHMAVFASSSLGYFHAESGAMILDEPEPTVNEGKPFMLNYTFRHWTLSRECVETLCKRYLARLDEVVKEGRSLGHLM